MYSIGGWMISPGILQQGIQVIAVGRDREQPLKGV